MLKFPGAAGTGLCVREKSYWGVPCGLIFPVVLCVLPVSAVHTYFLSPAFCLLRYPLAPVLLFNCSLLRKSSERKQGNAMATIQAADVAFTSPPRDACNVFPAAASSLPPSAIITSGDDRLPHTAHRFFTNPGSCSRSARISRAMYAQGILR